MRNDTQLSGLAFPIPHVCVTVSLFPVDVQSRWIPGHRTVREQRSGESAPMHFMFVSRSMLHNGFLMADGTPGTVVQAMTLSNDATPGNRLVPRNSWTALYRYDHPFPERWLDSHDEPRSLYFCTVHHRFTSCALARPLSSSSTGVPKKLRRHADFETVCPARFPRK